MENGQLTILKVIDVALLSIFHFPFSIFHFPFYIFALMLIYHIVLPDVWAKFAGKPSYHAESLQSEGFIHCSYANQLDEVLKRYYAGVPTVLILSLETGKLISKLVEEPSTNNEIYPHIYGRINRSAIAAIEERRI